MYTFSPKKQAEQGFALLLSIIISSIVLAIGVSLLHLSVSQINLASNARESEIAFQASHAGIDCLWYWRNDVPVASGGKGIGGGAFLATSTAAVPPISCFGKSAASGLNEDHSPVSKLAGDSNWNTSGGWIEKYSYDFTWGTGSGDRCTQVDMYIMYPGVDDMIHDFNSVNEGIGNGSPKVCEVSNLCTVIVSRGYNRTCSVVNAGTSVFTIQREITFEF